MNDVDRQILSFMRDVTVPEQEYITTGFVNDNIEDEIRDSHLQSLESKGLISKIGNNTNNTGYYINSNGLQAITTEDLNQTLSSTNDRLVETQNELNDMQESQSKSAAVQTIFSVTIILYTVYQTFSNSLAYSSNTSTLVMLSILVPGIILAFFAILFGKESLVRAWQAK